MEKKAGSVPSNQKDSREGDSTPLPGVNLPKGGGAISGIGEKFAVNACTGTGSLSIPVFLTPGRAGFTPQLSLSYDSGNGNDYFGFGWNMGIANISRKTAKGIPQYKDETDSFLLSGAEDLVPFLHENAGSWEPIKREEDNYNVYAYRPRIEGLFSKIEKWENIFTGEIHWKTVGKTNITSFYGLTVDARIFDPEDPQHVFQWLIEKSYDAKGNIICYKYKRENTEGISASLSYEGIRLKEQKSFNHIYLKSVQYGNKIAGGDDDFHFQLILDYGEHNLVSPTLDEQHPWSVRKDPFSRFNSGFEIRQYRLCQRLLLFHEFEELGEEPLLVRSMTMGYAESEKASTLISVQQNGYKVSKDGIAVSKSFPVLSFAYSDASLGTEIKTVDSGSIDNLPFGVDGYSYQWLDLEGEGLPGIFTESAGGWYYKNNRGEAGFTSPHLVVEKPHPSTGNRAQPVFSDIDADGSLELVINGTVMKGYTEQSESQWQHFTPFELYPAIPQNSPDLKYIDLTGDGFADILISEDEVFTWYPSRGKKGYGPSEYVRKALEEEKGPAIIFSNAEQSIYLIDMTGDGLNDIVRIRNGEIAYWPNKGYGKFGAKIIMEDAPVMDFPELFNQKNIRLFDVDGTGTTDIIYCAGDIVKIWYNYSGNSWSEVEEITSFPPIDNLSTFSVVDLLGKGTGCLVWSTLLPGNEGKQLSYIDLMAAGKPYLMVSVNNNMGKETLLEYTSSTAFYLEDLLNGKPWVTRLHFPVHVLKKLTVTDQISSSRLITSYKYHHGYFDGEEREFRGFGMAEQTDSESFETHNLGNELDMPPIYSKTWFHTGAYTKQKIISRQFSNEYYNADTLAHPFPDSVIENAGQLDYVHLREAYRSLKGKTLRRELYALDKTVNEGTPYTVTETNFRVQQLQPRANEIFGVYMAVGSESLVYSYERNRDDPRIAHTVLLESDEFGHPLKTIQIAYPRRSAAEGSYTEQKQLYVTAQTNSYFNELEDFYLIGVGLEQKSYEINGLTLAPDACFNMDDLKNQLENIFEEDIVLSHHEMFTVGVQVRLLSWSKNFFWNDENTALPFGELSALALPHHAEQIAMSNEWVDQVYAGKVNEAMMETAGYTSIDGHWWNTGATVYYMNGASYYMPFKTIDSFGNQSLVYYDDHLLAVVKSEDALGNSVDAEIDYRTLAIMRITDINENISEALTDPLGMVIATTVYGTVNGEKRGDSPIDQFAEQAGFTMDDILANPAFYLQEATAFFYYNLESWINDQQPPHFINLLRENHTSELNSTETPIQIHLGYSDGFGRSLQQKVKAEDDDHGNEQWLVTGRTVYNNKEKPVKQYEPFYSNTYAYQDEDEIAPVGVTPVMYYDPFGRVYKTETPKGFHSKVIFDSWQVNTYDENDTVKDTLYYQDHIGLGDEESEALQKAAAHYNTPSVLILDSLARGFIALQYREEGGIPLTTYTTFDIKGNPLANTDPRQYEANMQRAGDEQLHNFEFKYDLAGNKLYTKSIDAGASWGLVNVLKNPVHNWNGREYHTQSTYDALHRPIEIKVDGNGLDQIVQRMEYGENEPNALDKNVKGQLVRQYDQSGISENILFDFKGQPLHTTRTLRTEYKTEVNWNDVASVAMEDEVFSLEIEYDVIGRIVKSIQPDGSISKPSYHQAGWLKKVDVQLKEEIDYTNFVESIEYNPKGQRTKIIYGNGVHTSYDYESTTFRLTHLITTRQETGGTITPLQDNSYVYDPVGNIVKITDNSYEKVFIANQQVDAANQFVYDALYQLKEATGREHLALSKTDYHQQSDVYKTIHFAHINDGNQLRNYTEQYDYDDAGNLIQIRHTGENPFTRDIAVSDISNRAITDEMDNTIDVESYFDAAGNINQLEHIQGIEWNYRNNIASVFIIERENGNDSEYYVYDGSGQRIRKVKETYDSAGGLLWKEEKIYLGGVEIKRKYRGTNESVWEDRTALHVMDDKKRIATVYYWNLSNDSSVTIDENKINYQLGNHLGSASMELNADGQLISYEEYFPYGGTSFTAGSNAAEVALKEYRYTGKERDDTTGLYYYGARYYASWMGRWLNPDPAGTVDGLNVFRYVKNNPVLLYDINGRESFNAGELTGYNRIEDTVYAEYKATQDTWISASAKEQGLNKFYSKAQGYGSYEGIVLDIHGNKWANTDLVNPGESYLIPVGQYNTPDPVPPKPVPPIPQPQPIPPQPVPVPPIPQPIPPPSSNPFKKAVRLAIDTISPDKVAIEGHLEGGASFVAGGGIEFLAGPTLSGTIITNPLSPDYMKVAVNPSFQGAVGIKGGAKAEGGPKGGGGITFGWGEFFGDSRNSTLESLPGWSVGGGIGVDMQAVAGAQGSFVGSASPSSKGVWVDVGADVSGFVGPGTGISGKGSGNVKYTFQPLVEMDLLPAPLRSAHQWFYENIY